MSTTSQGSSTATTESTAMSSTNTTTTSTTTSESTSTSSSSTTTSTPTSTSETSTTSTTSHSQTPTTRSSSSTETSSSSNNGNPSSSSSNSNPNSNSDTSTPGQSSTVSEATNNNTTLTAPATTVFQTTVILSTGDSRVTTVIQATSTLSAGSIVPAGVGIKGNNDTARVRAIVGGVVGGLLGLVLIALIGFFYIRHQRQKRIEKTFDGNFDPAATDKRSSTFNSIRGPVDRGGGGGTLPNVGSDEDILEDDGMGGRLAGTSIGGGIISPFILPPSSPVSRTSVDDPRRISDDRMISPQTTGSSSFNPYVNYVYPTPSPVAASHVQRRSISPNSARHPPSSFSYPNVNVYNNTPNAERPPPSESSGSEYTPSHSSVAAAKEREARGFNVTNPDTDPFVNNRLTRERRENYLRSGPSRSQDQGGDVPDEIPPSYDSLLDR